MKRDHFHACYAILGAKLQGGSLPIPEGQMGIKSLTSKYSFGSTTSFGENRITYLSSFAAAQDDTSGRWQKEEGWEKVPGTRSFAAAQDDTSRMNRLFTPDELLEAMHTQPAYTQIIEKEKQI
jgi:hypothetical protein